MKEMTFEEMEKVEAGDVWHAVCVTGWMAVGLLLGGLGGGVLGGLFGESVC